MGNELNITGEQYRGMLRLSKMAGANKGELDVLHRLSVDEFLEHERLPEWLCWYAKNVLRYRWKDAEPIISQDAEWSCWYALNILRSRWKDAEETISTDKYYWSLYRSEFNF